MQTTGLPAGGAVLRLSEGVNRKHQSCGPTAPALQDTRQPHCQGWVTRDQERHQGGCHAPGARPWLSPWTVLAASPGGLQAWHEGHGLLCHACLCAGPGGCPGSGETFRAGGFLSLTGVTKQKGSGDIRDHCPRLEKKALGPLGPAADPGTGSVRGHPPPRASQSSPSALLPPPALPPCPSCTSA